MEMKGIGLQSLERKIFDRELILVFLNMKVW